MLTREEHLLVILGEECAEVVKVVAKALRFGLDERNIFNPDGPTNRERLASELTDVAASIDLLREEGTFPDGWYDNSACHQKIAKVREFMLYAEQLGTLEPAPPAEGRGSEEL